MKICPFVSVVFMLIVTPTTNALAAPEQRRLLSDRQVRDIPRHPKVWDGRTVSIRFYPYDNGYTESYVVCFRKCNEEEARRSPYIIYTRPGRFSGVKGDTLVTVTAKIATTCMYRYSVLCPEYRPGQFEEIPSP